jgi:tetratricopeptide (TPR) repeat protein
MEQAIAFPPDASCLAIATAPGHVSLADVSSGEIFATLNTPERSAITALQFTVDSSCLICVSQSPIVVWDLGAIRAGLASIGLEWSERAGANRAPAQARPEIDRVIVDTGHALKTQQLLSSLRTARKNAATFPDDPGRWDHLAEVQKDLGDIAGALHSATRALELQTNADFRQFRATWSAAIGHYEQAIADYKILMLEGRYRGVANKDLAYLYLESPHPWRNPAAAKQLASNYLQDHPQDSVAASRLARALYLQNEFEQALELGRTFCNPQSASMTCFVVAMAQARLGNVSEAEKNFEIALKPVLRMRDIDLFKRFYYPIAHEAEVTIAEAKAKSSRPRTEL